MRNIKQTKIVSKQLRHNKKIDQQTRLPYYVSNIIENKIIVPNHRVSEKIKCNCEICILSENPKTSESYISPYHKRVHSPAQKTKSDLKELLQYITTNNTRKGLKILIPQICFYSKYQPESIFMTSKQEIKEIKPTKLSEKQVLQLFLQQKKLYKIGLMENFRKNLRHYVQMNKQIHIKYLKNILPTYKEGGTQRQIGINNYVMHKNDKLVLDPVEEQKLRNSDQICLIRYLSGYCQLVTQNEFKQIMKSKKKIQSDIQMIQGFIQPKNQGQGLLNSKYVHAEIEYPILYKLAEKEVQLILGITTIISPEYKSQQALQEYNNSLKAVPHEYVIYQTYKIVHYIHKTSDIKVYKLKLAWVINDIDLYYMTEVHNFIYEKVDYEFDRKFTKYQFDKVKSEITQFKGIENWLLQKWTEVKRNKQIMTQTRDSTKFTRSQEVFQHFFPNSSFNKLLQSEKFAKNVELLTSSTAAKTSNSTRSMRNRSTLRYRSRMIQTQKTDSFWKNQ